MECRLYLRGSLYHKKFSIFETLRSTLHAIRHQILPDELDHARIVVAIREIVIQGREAMPLAGFLHVLQLPIFELVMIDISPVIS